MMCVQFSVSIGAKAKRIKLTRVHTFMCQDESILRAAAVEKLQIIPLCAKIRIFARPAKFLMQNRANSQLRTVSSILSLSDDFGSLFEKLRHIVSCCRPVCY